MTPFCVADKVEKEQFKKVIRMIYGNLFGCVFAYPIQVFASLDNVLQTEQEQLFQAQSSISSEKSKKRPTEANNITSRK